MNCTACNKRIVELVYCENNCRRPYCSWECSNPFHIEDDIPGSCPGVCWCKLCRDAHLEFSKGHIWLHDWHNESTELEIYGWKSPTDYPIFLPKCSKCGMWGYEFESKTDIPSKYEGKSCSDKIRDFEEQPYRVVKDTDWANLYLKNINNM